MRKTKIVCTIGPASESIEKLEQLIEAGMNVARLNFSHGSHEEHGARIKTFVKLQRKLVKQLVSYLIQKVQEIRTHDFVDGQAELVTGAEVVLSTEQVLGTAEKFSVSYAGLYDDVDPGSRILIDDGLIELEVIEKADGNIRTKVLNSGTVKIKRC